MSESSEKVETHWQFCLGDRDITGEMRASVDADEARLWTEDGILVVALRRNEEIEYGEIWRVAASDTYDWASDDRGFFEPTDWQPLSKEQREQLQQLREIVNSDEAGA